MSRLRSGPLAPLLGVGALLLLLVAWTLLQRSLGLSLDLGGRLVTALVLGGPAAWLSWIYWRRIDEAAREAQRVAWFWGSAVGLAVGMLGILIAGRAGSDFFGLAAAAEPWRLMFHGATVLAVTQFAAFLVAWAWWWWSKR